VALDSFVRLPSSAETARIENELAARAWPARSGACGTAGGAPMRIICTGHTQYNGVRLTPGSALEVDTLERNRLLEAYGGTVGIRRPADGGGAIEYSLFVAPYVWNEWERRRLAREADQADRDAGYAEREAIRLATKARELRAQIDELKD